MKYTFETSDEYLDDKIIDLFGGLSVEDLTRARTEVNRLLENEYKFKSINRITMTYAEELEYNKFHSCRDALVALHSRLGYLLDANYQLDMMRSIFTKTVDEEIQNEK